MRLYQGDFKGALKAAERGLAILKKRGVYNEDPNTSRLLDVKGRALEGLHKLGPAATALSQAVKLDQKQVGTDHPKYATHRANLATVQDAQKNSRRPARATSRPCASTSRCWAVPVIRT